MNNLLNKLTSVYKNPWESLTIYWETHGGLRAIVLSPYFHFSLIISLMLHGLWRQAGWTSYVFDIVPDMLGFTLGGYAIWLAIGDERYRSFLAQKREGQAQSAFLQMNARFAHFLLIQASALIIALLASYFQQSLALAFVGFTLLIYAIAGAVALALAIFRYSRIYEAFINKHKSPPNPSSPPNHQP